MKLKTINIVQILIIISAIIESSFALLSDLGLNESTITKIRLAGLIITVILSHIKKPKDEGETI